MNPTTIFAALAALSFAASACSPPSADNQQAAGNAQGPLVGARIGGPFTLTNQDGQRVTDKDFAGKYRIVYFGYSYCPDICPTDLQTIAAGLKAFEGQNPDAAAKITPIMITVDPVRDTAAVLKAYLAAFHPRFVGLTGSPEEIAAAAKAYAVYYTRRENPGGEYLMDHSNQAYLMGPDGGPIALLPQDETPQAVAAELARWVR
jgi:protein SCO1